MSVNSRYNFVPLSENVVSPEWADQVSHDIPFSDGLSGTIQLQIQLETDAFIRDSSSENADEFFFAEVAGVERCIIPGSSLKGVLRNVLEIASFGRLKTFSDSRYSYRDLRMKEYKDRITEKHGDTIVSMAKAGWLSCSEDDSGHIEYFLTPCEYARVEQSDINDRLGCRKESAVEKYSSNYRKSLDVQFTLSADNEHTHSCGLMRYKKVEKLSGDKKGRLVFTGQPVKREKNVRKRKHMEFVFYDEHTETKPVSRHLFENFAFVHSDPSGIPLPEWKYWKNKMQKGESVPVFYLENDDGSIHSFGLAMMYRLPYPYSIGDAVKNVSEDHLNDSITDFADLLFGHVNKPMALKGRVQCGHCVSLQTRNELTHQAKECTLILGAPRPTFTPNYVEPCKGKPSNYCDENVKIRGWKRYPVENGEAEYNSDVTAAGRPENHNVGTHFKSIPTGTVFEGKIRVHNLKPVELGALLWVLTWGEDYACQHQLGMAKPYGFGRIAIDQIELSLQSNQGDVEEKSVYIAKFVEYMNQQIAGWQETDQLRELKAMADIRRKADKYSHVYPSLAGEGSNSFQDIKRHNLILMRYSEASIEDQSIPVLSPEEKKQKAALDQAKQIAFEGPDGDLLKKIYGFKNSEFKQFFFNDATAEDAAVVIRHFDKLQTGQKKELLKARRKGSGDRYDKIWAAEEAAGQTLE